MIEMIDSSLFGHSPIIATVLNVKKIVYVAPVCILESKGLYAV